MLSFLTTIKNEFLSYFVPEKMEYKITGKCLKCGKCCRYMYSFDTYTTTDQIAQKDSHVQQQYLLSLLPQLHPKWSQ